MDSTYVSHTGRTVVELIANDLVLDGYDLRGTGGRGVGCGGGGGVRGG